MITVVQSSILDVSHIGVLEEFVRLVFAMHSEIYLCLRASSEQAPVWVKNQHKRCFKSHPNYLNVPGLNSSILGKIKLGIIVSLTELNKL